MARCRPVTWPAVKSFLKHAQIKKELSGKHQASSTKLQAPAGQLQVVEKKI